MIEFNEKIIGIWYVSTIPDEQDWMGAVSEIAPEEKYKLVYRFRYYKDDKIFESEDKRNWYRCECSGSRAYCIASLRNVAKGLADAAGGQQVYETINNGDYQDFLRRFQAQPFVFMRMESKPDGKPKDGIGRMPI